MKTFEDIIDYSTLSSSPRASHYLWYLLLVIETTLLVRLGSEIFNSNLINWLPHWMNILTGYLVSPFILIQTQFFAPFNSPGLTTATAIFGYGLVTILMMIVKNRHLNLNRLHDTENLIRRKYGY